MNNSPEILNNPAFQRLSQAEELKNKMRAGIAQQLIASKKLSAMKLTEREVCIRYIVGESTSEVELRNRLCELGLEYFDVFWSDVNPTDKTSLEAQMIVKALGGLIAKTGAMVNVTTVDEVF